MFGFLNKHYEKREDDITKGYKEVIDGYKQLLDIHETNIKVSETSAKIELLKRLVDDGKIDQTVADEYAEIVLNECVMNIKLEG